MGADNLVREDYPKGDERKKRAPVTVVFQRPRLWVRPRIPFRAGPDGFDVFLDYLFCRAGILLLPAGDSSLGGNKNKRRSFGVCSPPPFVLKASEPCSIVFDLSPDLSGGSYSEGLYHASD